VWVHLVGEPAEGDRKQKAVREAEVAANRRKWLWPVLAAALLTACTHREMAPSAELAGDIANPSYRIGPGDGLQVHVWRNPELSQSVTVRPDGRITIPLVEDLDAANLTPSELARAIEGKLGQYLQDPLVTVMINNFVGPFSQQVRVVGAAAKPQAIPYRANMTLLDVMIATGGLTAFAAGDDAVLVRRTGDRAKEYRVRLDSLIRSGDVSADVPLLPGDVLIIPESFL